jgi:hypothetical protein
VSIKDLVVLGPMAVLVHTGFMGSRKLVASVTTWSNCNHYSMVVVGGRMR